MTSLIRRLLALLLVVAAPAQAQQHLPTQQPVTAETVPPAARPALWKIADADTTIYLFGTVHLLPRGIEWFDGPLANAFEASGELVTEIPEVGPGESQAVLLRRGVLPPGKTLRALLSKKEKAKYETALKHHNLPPSAFDRFKPWYAGVVLATLPLARQGYDVANGVEAQLHARNAALGRLRSGLETLDYQLALFDSLSPKVQKRYLLEVIDALPTLTAEIDKIVAAWSKGNPDALATLMNAEQDDPAMIAALLTNRNKAWAEWIKGRLDRPGTIFLAVGAGHLGGKDSVQELLGKKGIAVSRVQ